MVIFSRSLLVLATLALVACGGAESTADAAPQTPAASSAALETAAPAVTGKVHEVRIRSTNGGASGVYEPAEITVSPGDVVRFVMADAGAHNVEFPAAENAGASGLPAASPYMTAAGESWEMPVTMGSGTYNYICTPHAMMGMKGKITVQ